jgi:TPR repeat protein
MNMRTNSEGLSARMRMKHPNMIAYFIPEDRDNLSYIKNDLSVVSNTRRYTSVQGYSTSKQFYSPDYSRMTPSDDDYRRTLLWNPAVKPVDGKLQVELYNSSICNSIAVDVLGYHDNIIYSNAGGVETRVSADADGRHEVRKRRELKHDARRDSLFMARCDRDFEKAEIYHNKKNYKNALTIYIELVGHQYPAAFYRIGEYYQKGINLKKRPDLAAKFYERGAELGMARCCYELTRMYHNGEYYARDREKEVEMLELAADLAVPEAQYLFGEYLLEGSVVDNDTARAVSYFYDAAQAEHADAAFRYAEHMLRSGMESDSIFGTVDECMRFAADRGAHGAMLWLVGYEEARGKYREAYLMAKRLYLEGNSDAALYMGDCYMQGRGVRRDKRLAKDFYREAAAKGNERARRVLEEW